MRSLMSLIAFSAFLIITFSSPVKAGMLGCQNLTDSQRKNWHVCAETDKSECWSVVEPHLRMVSKKIMSVKNGPLLMVTFHKSNNVFAQVSYYGEYPFAKGSTVELDIDGKSLALATANDWAWPVDKAADKRVIKAMKRGNVAILRGRTSKGSVVEDTFTLSGFTAATKFAAKKCGLTFK